MRVDRFGVLQERKFRLLLSRGSRANLLDIQTTPSQLPFHIRELLPDDEFVEVHRGDSYLVALGSFHDRGKVSDSFRNILIDHKDPKQVMLALTAVAGEHLLFFGNSNDIWCRGNATGTERLYFSTGERQLVLSDREDLLARATKATLNPLGVAKFLCEPVGHSLNLIPTWQGVSLVNPGQFLFISETGKLEVKAWFAYPRSEPLEDVQTQRIGDSLLSSTLDGIANTSSVLTDLSGGYDSSVLTSLIANYSECQKVSAYTVGSASGGEDGYWARRVATRLSITNHFIDPPDCVPDTLDRFFSEVISTESPTILIANLAQIQRTARIARSFDAKVHISGHGGDHLFYGHPALLKDTLWKNPVGTIKKIRAFAGQYDWPAGRIYQRLKSRESYQEWARQHLVGDGKQIEMTEPVLGWGLPINYPSWMSTDFVEGLRDEVRNSHVSPLATSPGAHAELDAILQGADLARSLSQISNNFGVTQKMPFFNDKVLFSVIKVDPFARLDPWNYKNLLVKSAFGMVPNEAVARGSKDEGSSEFQSGLRSHHGEIREYLRETILGEMGIIDVDRLGESLSTANHPSLDDGRILTTLATEYWLRSI
ncbi:asparagine synthase-related protein [Corynebacterium cystitidis]|uniref:asparagine synthase-related protein n=1 Tax=Corynebacterium cystitidis TaxID=35757 RepID=UPI00211E6A93|nr:asparagine synthase C-terminal domain-containing protein [Corynebacterium cystitidis]